MSTTNDTPFREDARAEKTLWVAVLEQAINDAEALARRVQMDSSLWNDPLFRADVRSLTGYFQEQSMEPGGFGFICSLMDVDPDRFAKRINEKYLRTLTPVTERPTRMARLLAI